MSCLIDKSKWKKENGVDINYKFTSKNYFISSLVFESVVAQFVNTNKILIISIKLLNNKYI